MTSTWRYAVIGCKLKQNANEGCNSCASLAGLVLFYCMFYFTCDRSFSINMTISSINLTSEVEYTNLGIHQRRAPDWGRAMVTLERRWRCRRRRAGKVDHQTWWRAPSANDCRTDRTYKTETLVYVHGEVPPPSRPAALTQHNRHISLSWTLTTSSRLANRHRLQSVTN